MTRPDGNTPSIASKVEFLSQAGAYPEPTRRVEVVETHMSWVFLTETWAYKLKKPVRYPFLDFSTVEARRRDTMEEVRLNRRLAGDVYQGMVALTLTGGVMALGGGEEIVDWLVKMRRLPAGRMLDNLIRNDGVDLTELQRLADALVTFYGGAPAVAVTPAAYRARLIHYVEDNREELLQPAYRLDRETVQRISEALLALLHRRPRLFEARVETGRVVEGHGDLRPEHICLGPHPVVIDCLEFKREFRELDPVDELSFLAMECDWLGAGYVGTEVLAVYFRHSGDRGGGELVSFYRCHRAFLRAKIASWHTRDGAVRDHAKWCDRARAYLDLAQRYAKDLPG